MMTTQQFLWASWGWHPVVIGVCLAALIWQGRGARLPFYAAVAVFYLTLASPINALADGYLFSAHMLQHLLLLLVIPPLLLLGLPERQVERRRFHPFVGWLAGFSAMWVWHERTLCDFATTTTSVRVIQIVSLVALGIMFWQPIVGTSANRLAPLLGVVYLFSACVGCTILGILITFAPVGVVCPVYLHPVDHLGILPLIRGHWGITPKLDQQAGGLMMWVPACGIYVASIMGLLSRWYRSAESSVGFANGRAVRGNI